MAIYIAHVVQDRELGQTLARTLAQLRFAVGTQAPIPVFIPTKATIDGADAAIFIWSPNSVGNGDMRFAAEAAHADHAKDASKPSKRISLRLRSTERSSLPAQAGPPEDAILFDDTDAIVKALNGRGLIMPEKPKGPEWNPFVVFGVLIGILLLFFAYLSFPSFSSCPDRYAAEASCR
jgi:hypothetical protein